MTNEITPDATGGWIAYTGEPRTATHFDTQVQAAAFLATGLELSELEARQHMANKALLEDMARNMRKLGEVYEIGGDLAAEWYVNPPAETDYAALGITQAQATAWIVAFEQFKLWMDGATGEGVVAAQYKASYYPAKRVQA